MAVLSSSILALLLVTSGQAEKKICKVETANRSGTRLQRQKSCLTAAQWERRKNDTAIDVDLQEHTNKYSIQRCTQTSLNC
jgi:hypothetical protein